MWADDLFYVYLYIVYPWIVIIGDETDVWEALYRRDTPLHN